MQETKLNSKDILNLYSFATNNCPWPNHYCNGQHIPNIKKGVDNCKIPDREVCVYFGKRGCKHPSNPKTHKNHLTGKKVTPLCQQISQN